MTPRSPRIAPVGSCWSCLHFGWLPARSQCGPCEAWNRSYPAGSCAGCDRTGSGLKKSHCRGCWKQAAHQAGSLNTKVLFTDASRFPFQQLALTGLRTATPGVRRRRPLRPERPQLLSWQVGPVVGQLELFEVYRGLRATPSPRPPELAWDPDGPRAVVARHTRLKAHTIEVLEAVAEHGRERRWSPTVLARTRVTLITALNSQPQGPG